MRKYLVYMAGPITGLKYGDSVDWRNMVAAKINSEHIKCLSPMRAKEFLSNETNLGNNYDNPLASPKGIMTRDRFDCTRSDVVLVNLLGAKTVSIGTVMEIAWADLNRIPIVCVMEPENLHHHAMLVEACGYIVSSLDEAINIVKAVVGF